MMKNTVKMFAATVMAAATVGAVTNDWENTQVNSINRMPPRTYTMPLAAEADALTDALEPQTPFKMSLNGEWRYSWAGDPELRVRGFERVGFDDSKWFTIDVPSCVELRGFGSPGYTNIRYPHKMEWPRILDRQSGKADYNPVSSYRRTFSVPKEWRGRRVILRFDGVYSAYYVWINGTRVGYAEDSKLPSEFDVTDYLNADGAENLIAVEVYRWCDGSYLEDQDMTRYSGIFRDVTLWSMPADGIWDFAVKTTPVGGGYSDWRLEVSGAKGAEAALYDGEFKKVGAFKLEGEETSGGLSLKGVKVWSAEKPSLYTLVLKKGGDIRMKRIGFKEQKIVGNKFFVNGQPVKFKGVNRHETNPENGRTVSMADMVRDITLMKRYNINTVRTSHYPDHHLWYDLCDRYGIYLCAEANVEGHEPAYDEKGLGRFKEWEHTIVERNERHVKFYRNHPSVTLWSMGNETGHGDCFRKAITSVRQIDPSRPIHWERGNRDADVDSHMYPAVEWLEMRGKVGDGHADADEKALLEPWTGDNVQTKGKVFFMCEYGHAMGNAIGNFQEYWEVFYRYDSLCGGCVWDWIDQAVWKETDRVGADGKRERFLAYGGDFDEQPNDGPFNCNGVIDPERNVTAKLVEVGHVHRNLVVTRREDGKLELWNRFCFTDADEFDGEWALVADGEVVRRGAFKVPHVAPLSRGELAGIPQFKLADGKEYFLNIDFVLRDGSCWAEKGWPVARNQVAIGGAAKFGEVARAAVGGAVKIVEDDKTVTATCGGTRAVFCRKSGTLCELEMNGVRVLKDAAPGVVAGPQLTCERAFVDNDRWVSGSFVQSGLTQLRYHARPIEVKDGKIYTTVEVTGSKSAGFTHETEWTFAANGAISARNTVKPHGTMPGNLPRLGLSMKLDAALEKVRYYGRGPRENYVDRCTGSLIGIYDSTVTDLFEAYVRPQDNGYRGEVRWVSFAGADGRGVRFAASEPMFVQALHYSMEDLAWARPQNGQPRFRTPLKPRKEVCLNLDVRQAGLGGNSCGPAPLEKYRFKVEKTEWTVQLSPL